MCKHQGAELLYGNNRILQQSKKPLSVAVHFFGFKVAAKASVKAKILKTAIPELHCSINAFITRPFRNESPS